MSDEKFPEETIKAPRHETPAKSEDELRKLGLLDEDVFAELMEREANAAIQVDELARERQWRMIEKQTLPARQPQLVKTRTPWSMNVALSGIAAVLILSLGIWINQSQQSASHEGIKGQNTTLIPATLEILKLGEGPLTKIDPSQKVSPGAALVFRANSPQKAVAALLLEQPPGEWILIHPGMMLTAGQPIEFGTKDGLTGWTVQSVEQGPSTLRFCIVAVESGGSIREITDDVASTGLLPMIHECVQIGVEP